MLHDIPQRLRYELGVKEVEQVRFTQITATANSYRDAVRFSNGTELLLQRLEEGVDVHAVLHRFAGLSGEGDVGKIVIASETKSAELKFSPSIVWRLACLSYASSTAHGRSGACHSLLLLLIWRCSFIWGKPILISMDLQGSDQHGVY